MINAKKTVGAPVLLLLDLPDDVLFFILSFCDLVALSKLSRTCKRFTSLSQQDCVWKIRIKDFTIISDYNRRSKERTSRLLSIKEKCRISENWLKNKCNDIQIAHHREKQMPWLQLDGHHLWTSYQNGIRCYRIRPEGRSQNIKQLNIHCIIPSKKLRGHHQYRNSYVNRFVLKDDLIVSGARGGTICCHDSYTATLLWTGRVEKSHFDIQCVDFHQDIIVSGARDATVKIWNMGIDEENCPPQHLIELSDRIYSTAVSPNGSTFAFGTSGLSNIPLTVWDMTRATQLFGLGDDFRKGAGILDIQYESPNILLSCGHDTCIRMWDLRKTSQKMSDCVLKMEDPFDSTVYSIKSDLGYSIVAGTARHGLVRLWDKRSSKSLQMYYVGRASSPVYSVAFDAGHLYTGLDKGIHMLDFSVR